MRLPSATNDTPENQPRRRCPTPPEGLKLVLYEPLGGEPEASDLDAYRGWGVFGDAPIHCPVCSNARREVVIAKLAPRDRDGPQPVRILAVGGRGGDPLTANPREPIHLTCPKCRREFGPVTARGLRRRLRAGLPLMPR